MLEAIFEAVINFIVELFVDFCAFLASSFTQKKKEGDGDAGGDENPPASA
jgi:hypothetical protein